LEQGACERPRSGVEGVARCDSDAMERPGPAPSRETPDRYGAFPRWS
jgi:hypothetical protein